MPEQARAKDLPECYTFQWRRLFVLYSFKKGKLLERVGRKAMSLIPPKRGDGRQVAEANSYQLVT